MNRKKGIILAAVIILVFGVALILYFGGKRLGGGSSKEKVYVEQVASLGGAGAQNRYSGVVESQKTFDIQKNQERLIKEVFVKVGDEVIVGTPLFEYDTEEVQNQINQDRLELEDMENQISGFNHQIASLEGERRNAPEDQKFQYTTQIQTLQTSIKQTEFSKKSKEVEIQRQQQTIENAVVKSELAGIVKSMSESGADPMTGQPLPYMSILAMGEFRVRGKINEQNIWEIQQGQTVLIRSRLDESKVWEGVISEIDTTPATENSNSFMSFGGAPGETASTYSFYVPLDNIEGLMLGQHVFIELDFGQQEVMEGVWLYEGYLIMEEDSFVWVDNGKGKLEKRKVELGSYDENLGLYEVVSGVSNEDYITYPMPMLYEGMPTTTEEVLD